MRSALDARVHCELREAKLTKARLTIKPNNIIFLSAAACYSRTGSLAGALQEYILLSRNLFLCTYVLVNLFGFVAEKVSLVPGGVDVKCKTRGAPIFIVR